MTTACLFLAACSSIRLHSRTNPQAPVLTPFRSAVVIVADERQEVRMAFENRFVKFLKAHQVQAATSYAGFDWQDLKLTPEEVRQKLKPWGSETVLVTRVVDRETFTAGPRWTGGLLGPNPTWFDVDEFRMNLYGSGPEIRTAVQLETRLYRLDNGALVWAALTGVTTGETTDRLDKLTQVIGKIVEQMGKDRVIP